MKGIDKNYKKYNIMFEKLSPYDERVWCQ